MPGKAARVVITERQQDVLKEIAAARTSEVRMAQRAQIILLAFQRLNNEEISVQVDLNPDQIGRWRRRWQTAFAKLILVECNESRDVLRKSILSVLSDEHRSGRPPRITSEQQAKLVAMACEDPATEDRPLSHWSSSELRDRAIEMGIVEAISARWVRAILERSDVKPQSNKYWLTSPDRNDPDFDTRVTEVCDAYWSAIEAYETQGVHTVCIDEQTGIQALERIARDLLPRPGQVAKREFEYSRHGTVSLFGNFHVPTGKLLAPLLLATRTEEDFLQNLDSLVSLDADAPWRLIVDNLNTHSSESCVRYVAAACGITDDLGKKGVRGILQSQQTRKAFLSDPNHRIRFTYLPRHTSWLNQIEIWFGILRRKVTRFGNFPSVDALCDRIMNFVDYYNTALAHPFNWTYTGRILCR